PPSMLITMILIERMENRERAGGDRRSAARDRALNWRASMPWFAVGAAAAMLAVIMGMLVNGLTAFFVPMEHSEGWARADIASINSFGLIGLAFGSVAMGYVADRLSIRTVCLLAASTMGVCLIVASHAGSPWMLCALFFVAGALGGGTLFAPIFVYVGNWFPTGAGVAI